MARTTKAPKEQKVDKKLAKKIAEKKSLAGKIRELNDVEIQNKISDLKQELFNLRFSHATGQLTNPMQLVTVKKDIAKAKTILTERELNSKASK